MPPFAKQFHQTLRRVAAGAAIAGYFSSTSHRKKNAKLLLDRMLVKRLRFEEILMSPEQITITQELLFEAFRLGFEAGARAQ